MFKADRPTLPSEIFWLTVLYVIVAAVVIYLLVPILSVIPLSFSNSQFLSLPVRSFTWRWYEELFNSDRWHLAVKNSFLIGISAAAISTVLGTLAAIGLSLADFRGKSVVLSAIMSPMIVPVIVYAAGLYFLFAPLGLTQTHAGIILAHAAMGAPFVIITVSAVLAGFDWQLVRATQSLGAGPTIVVRRVMLPILAPGIISGAIFAFSASFDEVVIVLLLGGPGQRTLPREMFSSIRENISPVIAASAVFMLATIILLLLTLEWLRRWTRTKSGVA